MTGASGFVGRWASRALRDRGHTVHAVSRNPPADTEGIVWHTADVLDGASIGHALRDARAERLLHLAWITEHGAYWSSPENADWVDATKELVTKFTEVGGARVVCAGSCAEYDWTDGALEVADCDEAKTPTVPATLYGASKLAVAQWLAAREGVSSATGRIFFTYGEGEDPGRLVSSVARALLGGGRARTGPGGLIRDFMHVADVGAALAALVESDVRGPVNVGSGVGATVASVASLIAEVIGRPEALELGVLPGRPQDPLRIVASVERLRRGVGFMPAIDLETGLRRAVAWWRSVRVEETRERARGHAQ